MLDKIKNTIANDNELDRATLRVLSLTFLLISGAMSFFKYTHVGWLWNTNLTFISGFISSILAIFLIAPLYMRGILKWNKSIFTLISLVLILLVFASFVELALGGNDNNAIVISLLASAIILSWLGIKEIASISWVLALAAAIYSVVENNLAMGFYGFIYVASGFMGLVLHSGLNPGELLQGIKVEYSSSATKVTKTAKQNIDATVGKIT